ncbi:MAG: PEBP family protein [Candidatus Woesebacteria bacterium GW2011_GWA1_45_8]|uniref:PEBP family protein n=1 Tax=Candidatus Woesebacteria bacterium GW2011_GWA1_45_8 TaxID=1618559 RepID=A0A0G1Q2V3_9BACT|nr:MAG: PEBP family protein [Candidatus Woesebacteria bacterium GW2011_GWA1_45_8]
MKKNSVRGGILLIVAVIGVWYVSIPFVGPNKYVPKIAPVSKEAPKNMKLTSSAFTNEEKIPVEFTCDGKKVNPPLAISGIPEGAKSLAMIVDDPDAPAGTFTHWVIWNIDAATTEIGSGTIPPKSQEGTNSAGRIGYTPPCPPSGTHRYFFTLLALDTTIGLDAKAKKADLETAMKGHIMEQTNLIGAYGR